MSLVVFIDMLGLPADERSDVVTLYQWLPVGALHVDLAFLADPLSITMCLFVTGVGTLIHIYAIGYMHGDAKFSKFFLYMNLFAFSMLLLVLGENLLVTFVGWEGVGTCSYLLISFWHTRASAAPGRQEGLRHQPGPDHDRERLLEADVAAVEEAEYEQQRCPRPPAA